MGLVSAAKQGAVAASKAREVATPLARAAEDVRTVAAKFSFSTPAQTQKSTSVGTKALKTLAAEAKGRAASLPPAARDVVAKLETWQSPTAVSSTRAETLRFLASPQGRGLDDQSLAAIAKAFTNSTRRRSTRPLPEAPPAFPPAPSSAVLGRAIRELQEHSNPRWTDFAKTLHTAGYREVSTELPHAVRFENAAGNIIQLPSQEITGGVFADARPDFLNAITRNQRFAFPDAQLTRAYAIVKDPSTALPTVQYRAPAKELLKESLGTVMYGRKTPNVSTEIVNPQIARLHPDAKLYVYSGSRTHPRGVTLSLPARGKTDVRDLERLRGSLPEATELNLSLERTPAHSRIRLDPTRLRLDPIDGRPLLDAGQLPVGGWADRLVDAQQRLGVNVEGLHDTRVLTTYYGVDFQIVARAEAGRLRMGGVFDEGPNTTLTRQQRLDAARKLGAEASSGTTVPVELVVRLDGHDGPRTTLHFLDGKPVRA